MTWTRRRLLQVGGALAGASAAGFALGGARGADSGPNRDVDSRRIALVNLHTGEKLEIDYRRGGDYVPEALSRIEAVLRDFRTGDQHPIDPKLMDYLCDVAQALGAEPTFHVISGYRSPQTNARLHAKSTGVAEHSLHMQGRAIDVRISGVDCARLAEHALDLKFGGVGYYRASDFVHLDTGAFRAWKG